MVRNDKVMKFKGDWENFEVLVEAAEMEWEARAAEKEMAKTSERKNHNKRVQKQECKSEPVKKRRKMTIVCPEPQMPPLLKRRIEEIAGVGTATVWLNAKELTISDVKEHLDRLFIPKTEALKQFLNEKEIENLDRTNNRTKVVDHEGDEWDLIFKYWTKVNQYVFTSQWYQLVADKGLQSGEVLQVWGFRCKDKPCFAINKVGQRSELANTDGASSSRQQ
ncbi:hypothetical protein NE237_016033 [Protea cynaroides]|uniref:TF-B3 domain-containing protein n=1 Tax=Protea cynaroides TaxID=273540 RepID=A0A9Q0KF46_9MAGN|nr:hypothetical protein NE237_016033 [Protea cynaroides]